MILFTFGHGTATQEAIAAILQRAGIGLVVDVRIAPGSRRPPHVARAELERWLPEAGIDYRWERRLGGFRRPAPDSPDTAWRNESFRGYAGWTRSDDFAHAMDELVADAGRTRATVMCSESLWWQCHRRLIADVAVLLRATPVVHLMHDGRDTEHVPTPTARVVDGVSLVYDLDQASLPFDD